MRLIYFWSSLIVIVLILILSFGNSSTNIPIFIFLKPTQTSLAIALLLMSILGFIGGVLAGFYLMSKGMESFNNDNLS